MEEGEDEDEELGGDMDESDLDMWDEDPPVCPACGERLDPDDEIGIEAIDKIASRLPKDDVTEWCEEWLWTFADTEELADFIVAELKADTELASLVRERMGGGDG